MKSLSNLAVVLTLTSSALFAQTETKPHIGFTGCTYLTSTSNDPMGQDVTETYRCDQGDITLAGKWTKEVEHGYLYQKQLGRLESNPFAPPEKATMFDRDFFKWCQDGPLMVTMCGWNESYRHGPISTSQWFPEPSRFPPLPPTLAILAWNFRMEPTTQKTQETK